MDIHQLLGQTAGVIAALATIPYVRSILRGETKPNRASWLIWAVVNWSLVFSYHFSGATTTIWLNIVYVFTTTTIFLLSIKRGVGGYTFLDIVCLIGAAIGLLLWWITDNPATAVYLNVLVDAVGFIPTLRKAYLEPQTENKLAWGISTFSNAVNVAALTTGRFTIILFPIYNFVFNGATFVLLYGVLQKKIRRFFSSSAAS